MSTLINQPIDLLELDEFSDRPLINLTCEYLLPDVEARFMIHELPGIEKRYEAAIYFSFKEELDEETRMAFQDLLEPHHFPGVSVSAEALCKEHDTCAILGGIVAKAADFDMDTESRCDHRYKIHISLGAKTISESLPAEVVQKFIKPLE